MINIETQKERLLEEKKTLLEELKKISIKDDENNKYETKEVLDAMDVHDLEDRALELADFDNNYTLTMELQNQLAEVEAALERIENEEYGICIICGQEIEEKRLMVLPAASTCREHMEIEVE